MPIDDNAAPGDEIGRIPAIALSRSTLDMATPAQRDRLREGDARIGWG
jgi:hypothetical protein